MQLWAGQDESVHELPSQGDPSGAGVETHASAGSQESTVQGFESSQLTGVLAQAPVAGSQKPARQRSDTAQSNRSLVHVPATQRSRVHASPSPQVGSLEQQPTMAVPRQAPARQVSADVQSLPSLQGVLSAGAAAHPVSGLQKSAVQGFPSSHDTAECSQPPSVPHASDVHKSPSSQLAGEQADGHSPSVSPWRKCAEMAGLPMVMVCPE